MSLGSFIREKRAARHLTLGQLARKLGKRWDVVRLASVEHDRAVEGALTPEDFEILAEALDVDIDLLIDASDLCPHCLGTGKK